jgi:hypothetical protein
MREPISTIGEFSQTLIEADYEREQRNNWDEDIFIPKLICPIPHTTRFTALIYYKVSRKYPKKATVRRYGKKAIMRRKVH